MRRPDLALRAEESWLPHARNRTRIATRSARSREACRTASWSLNKTHIGPDGNIPNRRNVALGDIVQYDFDGNGYWD